MNKGWKFGDAIHYLTMAKNGITEIVTDDGHFDNLQGIERMDILTMTF